MPLEKESETFFEGNCFGVLRSGDRTLDIVFLLTCSREGELLLAIEDVPLGKDKLWIRGVFNEPSKMPIALDAKDDKSRNITSTTIYLTSVGTRSTEDDSWLTLEAIAMWLEVSEPDFSFDAPATGVRAAYFPVGIRTFGRQEVETRAGNLKLLAQTTVNNFNEITGRFDIEAPKSSPSIKEWLEVADDVSYEILDIISFAEGRLIRWSVRYLVVDKYVRVISFRGPSRTASRQRGYHHWLDLQPVLELAARSYTRELKASTGIDVALEWSLMNPRYLELDFVSCMTALEHLAKVYNDKHSKAVSPGREFFETAVEPVLLKDLAALQTEDLTADAASAIQKAMNKIGELARPTLQDSLAHMLTGYGVPMGGLEGVLSGLIKLRNDIVHRGVTRERAEREIRREIEKVRELLTRIFLRLLNYEGRYDSYLTGKQETVLFPPGG